MNKKLSITFSTVPELLLKTEQIKDFAIQQKSKRKAQFDEIGVTYDDLNEFGFAIDMVTLTEDQILAIKEIVSDSTLKEFVNILES
jgi:hypothetical protein